MLEETLTTHELLEQWRDATRAAALAERLAKVAAESAARANEAAIDAEEIARMAEQVAKSAEETARAARLTADRAAAARDSGAHTLADADQSISNTRADEAAASSLYHDAERDARARHES